MLFRAGDETLNYSAVQKSIKYICVFVAFRVFWAESPDMQQKQSISVCFKIVMVLIVELEKSVLLEHSLMQ